jgi:hypothetical protein
MPPLSMNLMAMDALAIAAVVFLAALPGAMRVSRLDPSRLMRG